jgi:hypothetical protein
MILLKNLLRFMVIYRKVLNIWPLVNMQMTFRFYFVIDACYTSVTVNLSVILTHNLIRNRGRVLRNRLRCAAKFRTDRETDELRVKRSLRVLCGAGIAHSV